MSILSVSLQNTGSFVFASKCGAPQTSSNTVLFPLYSPSHLHTQTCFSASSITCNQGSIFFLQKWRRAAMSRELEVGTLAWALGSASLFWYLYTEQLSLCEVSSTDTWKQFLEVKTNNIRDHFLRHLVMIGMQFCHQFNLSSIYFPLERYDDPNNHLAK